MSYDTRCYELAELFLSDEPTIGEAGKKELAQLIQTTIEDWINYERKFAPPPSSSKGERR